MVTACVEAVDDRDVCKGVWPTCEHKVNLILCVTIGWDPCPTPVGALLEHCVEHCEVDQGITSGVVCAQSVGTSAEFWRIALSNFGVEVTHNDVVVGFVVVDELIVVSWATLSEMPLKLVTLPAMFLDYEANAILVGIASLVVELVTTLVQG